jgi:arylsulfatase A-like enzyme
MPSGNLAIFEFAKRAIGAILPLHVEDECKVLNICLDVPRTVAERYGTDSIEYEDMLYSLDASLAEFLTFLYAQLSTREDVMVVLTSDGGVSPSNRVNSDATRFNTRQFEVIMNAFLGARYGQDAWVLGYTNGSLYLNHDVVYRHKKSLAEVQNEAATFALQYRGVSAAVTATALRSSQFSRGAMALLQNGYNPRRSGDVLITLEPERIELDSRRVAMSGSIYNYDRHIPFIVSGAGIPPREVSQRVSNEQIAPSLAVLMGVERPQSSDAAVVDLNSVK